MKRKEREKIQELFEVEKSNNLALFIARNPNATNDDLFNECLRHEEEFIKKIAQENKIMNK